MSDTPRTDAALGGTEDTMFDKGIPVVMRQLERELAATQERAMRAVKLQDQLYAVRIDLAAAQAKLIALAEINAGLVKGKKEEPPSS